MKKILIELVESYVSLTASTIFQSDNIPSCLFNELIGLFLQFSI